MDTKGTNEASRRQAVAGDRIRSLVKAGTDYQTAYKRVWREIIEEERSRARGEIPDHWHKPVQTAGRQECCGRKGGKPCPHEGNRWVDGKAYCHYHDPFGKFQINLSNGKKRRKCYQNQKAAALPAGFSLRAPTPEKPAFTTTMPPVQLDPNWTDPCPFEAQ